VNCPRTPSRHAICKAMACPMGYGPQPERPGKKSLDGKTGKEVILEERSKGAPAVYYNDYLGTESLLAIQNPRSTAAGNDIHDEMLFIITHQAYELWFKQILHELQSIVGIFGSPPVSDQDIYKVTTRMQRVVKIQAVMMHQLEVLETMTPLDFLEFRDYLTPASGFQSTQWRQIEILMGIPLENRPYVSNSFVQSVFTEKDRGMLKEFSQGLSLFQHVEMWLERLKLTEHEDFNFWKAYETAVEDMLKKDEATIRSTLEGLGDEAVDAELKQLDSTRTTFQSLLDANMHKEFVDRGVRRFSQKAMLNALFIMLYRDEPLFHVPHMFLQLIMDAEKGFTAWRHGHAMMAHRMIGAKIGSGGTAGIQYLQRAAANNKAFVDLVNLSTFMLPRNSLPEIPGAIWQQMQFQAAPQTPPMGPAAE